LTYYLGQWCNGLKHGKGKKLNKSGITYEGEFKNGKINGEGEVLDLYKRKAVG